MAIGLTVFGVDVLLNHQKAVDERPLRLTALEECSVAFARIQTLWQELMKEVHGKDWSGDWLSDKNLEDVGLLTLANAAPVLPARPWADYLPGAVDAINDVIDGMSRRGHTSYLSPPLRSALVDIQSSDFFALSKSVRAMVQARVALSMETPNFPSMPDSEFFEAVRLARAEMRRLIVNEQQLGVLPGRLQRFLEHVDSAGNYV